MKLNLVQATALISSLAAQANAYNCWANTADAGRWRDGAWVPSDRLLKLCLGGNGERCHQGAAGKVCISGPGDVNFCLFAWEWAINAQSQQGDWFLWSDITCDGGPIGTADDLSIRIL